MSTSFAQNAISMLIDMAQRGEIDPWDVQVIDVFDRFLNELSFQDSQELATSGQAFLYASMLVLLKAETLDPHLAEPEAEEDFEQLYLGEGNSERDSLPSPLEACLQRRPVACPPQHRRVTLSELIHQLELMAVAVERQSKRPKTRRMKRPTKAQSLKAISQLAHQENLSEVAEELEELLADLCLDANWLDLRELLTIKNDPVGIFWALLLLCSQSKVELDQSNFYQDLRLRPLQPEPPITVELPPSFKSAAS